MADFLKRLIALIGMGTFLIVSMVFFATKFYVFGSMFLALAAVAACWFWARDRKAIAGLAQAMVAVVLLGVTWNNTVENWKASEIQRAIANQYLQELQESRKQQLRPYVFVFFDYAPDIGRFRTIIQNIGIGPAFDIRYSYTFTDEDGKKSTRQGSSPVLSAGGEMRGPLAFTDRDIKGKRQVKVDVSYKDLLGKSFTDSFEHNLAELADDPPPSKHSEWLRSRMNPVSQPKDKQP